MELKSQVLARFRIAKTRKTPWLDQWQLIGEYVHGRKQNFTQPMQPGDFLAREIFDGTAGKANDLLASSLIGMMWPNGARSIKIVPPRGLSDSEENRDYYAFLSQTIADAMDDPKAGLATALDEYMKDEGSFGTAGLEIARGVEGESLLSFRAWSIKEMTIVEGPHKKVQSIYLELEWTADQLVEFYGMDKVSPTVANCVKNGKGDEKIKFLIALEPRVNRDKSKAGNKDMPIRSLHIEIATEHVMLESGFSELPIKVGRFTKMIGEEYGRSPAMMALPDILELNAIWESVTIAIEKAMDPPLAILDDGRLGGGTIDTSAGAINVFNITGRAGERQPIFPIFTVQELKSAEAIITKLTESITNHFYIDRLLDLNNENEMTLGEAQIRNRLRGSSLGSIISRQVEETFNPLVEGVFNKLFEMGELGYIQGSIEAHMKELEGETVVYIPQEVADRMKKGQNVYEIKYISPAARVMEAEEAQGITQTMQLAGELAPAMPEVADVIDFEYGMRRFTEISGAPIRMINSAEKIAAIREQRAAQQQAMAQMQVVKDGAKSAKDLASAGLIPGAGGGTKKAA